MRAYVLPFVLYLGLTQIPAAYPEQYGWLYAAVVAVVGLATFGLLHGRRLIQPHRDILAGTAVGLLSIILWIALCQLHLEEYVAVYFPSWLQPRRVAFNPFESLTQPAARWAFLVARLAGLVILVPVVEELFWRGFLLRWLTSPDWEHQKLGDSSPQAFAMVTLLFTLAHPEWLAAAVYCCLLNGLMCWKRDLWSCITAHGVSNLVLAVYVLTTGSWELW